MTPRRRDLSQLIRVLTRFVVVILGASGVVMAILSPHSGQAALYTVIFLGVTLALVWAISERGQRK